MGKDKKKSKAKGERELSPKEVAALEKREAQLKAALKTAAKIKKRDTPPEASGPAVVKPHADHPHVKHLERIGELTAILADETASKKAKKAARAELAEHRAEGERINAAKPPIPAEVLADLGAQMGGTLEVDETDEQIKAKVKAKRKARELGVNPDDIDRDDEAAVAEYNNTVGKETGHYLTSNAEKARRATEVGGESANMSAEAHEVATEPLEPGTVHVGIDEEKGGGYVVDLTDELNATPTLTETAAAMVAEVVETETGTIISVGTSVAEGDEFATVADAPPAIERDYLGRPKIVDPATGKSKAYTRCTTYIDCLEDKTALDKWKQRVLLEGVVANEDEVGTAVNGKVMELFTSDVRDAMHTRDVALKRLEKADRKGKLEVGELGTKTEEVVKAFKATLDRIASDALELGGAHEKAERGTWLHLLCEEYDESPMGIESWLLDQEEGRLSPADIADVRAYAEAMARYGAKVLECEVFVVDDAAHVAGTADRILMAKPKGGQRAVRMVGDLKTGRVDYGIGKIAMQIKQYAKSKGYDPATPDERRDLKVSQTKGLLIHLPAGTATCTIHEVDLVAGELGLKLAAEVRSWRNTGKRAIDLKTDLAAPATEAVAS